MADSKRWTGIYTVIENAEPYEQGFPDRHMNLQGAISSGLGRAGESEWIKGLKGLVRMAGSQTWELGFG